MPEFVLPVIFSIFVVLLVIFMIVWSARQMRSYFFQFHSHEIVLRIRASFALYVDGNLEDEFMAQNVRLVTLRAMVDGEEVKVRVHIKLRPEITATAGGKELLLVKVEK